VDTDGPDMKVYVTNKVFALARNPAAEYSAKHRAWLVGVIPGASRLAAE